MVDRSGLRRGMVLEPLLQPETEHRLCVLLDDVTASPVRVQVAHRDTEGRIRVTGQEFTIPPSALDMLRPVSGLFVEDLPAMAGCCGR